MKERKRSPCECKSLTQANIVFS